MNSLADDLPEPFALTVALLRADADPRTWSARASTADGEALAVTAIVLGLGPYLAWRAESLGAHLPPAAAGKLAAVRAAGRAHQTAIEAQLSELLDALAARGVEPIVLKGAALAALAYPQPGLRPMNDIDLLFRPEDYAAAVEALHGLGYLAKHRPADLGPGITKHTSTFRRPEAGARTPNPYLSPQADRTVEPHHSLEESWFGLRVDVTPGVWERSRMATRAGSAGGMRVLGAEDTALHLAVHLTFHLIMGAPAMVQLLDLLVVAQRWEREVDWTEVAERARARRAAPFAYAALRLAAQALAAPVPVEALTALAQASPAHSRRAAQALSLRDVLRRTQQPPLVTIPQRLRRGLADRAEAARWASDMRARWRVWRTLFGVARTDTGRLIGQRLVGMFRMSQCG